MTVENAAAQIFVPSVNTKFFVLFGDPLAFSVSAWMHNHVFRKLGMDCLYSPLETAEGELGTAVKTMETWHCAGANVTMPFKAKVVPYLDDLADSARYTEVVNTIVFGEDGRKVGHNTDGEGFVQSLYSPLGLDVPSKEYLILGAGGAASAIACTLAAKGVKRILVLSRKSSFHRVEALKKRMDDHFPGVCSIDEMSEDVLRRAVPAHEVIINATKVGMGPYADQTVFNTDLLSPSQAVCDVVYNPRETKMILEAKKKGCKAIGGLWMLVNQGAEALRLWTGIEPPVDFMYETACRFLDS